MQIALTKAGMPRCAPSELDRQLDVDLMVDRWLSGAFSHIRLKYQLKRRLFDINFHTNECTIGRYVTIIDLSSGTNRRIYY